MSLPRFHLPAAAWASPQLTLVDDEAAHCARVMRKKPGDAIEIFDGEGRVAVCEITDVSKHAVHARVTSESRVAPFATAIHLFPALIKAEPFEWLLEKAVELGAASVQPVITERTVIHLDGSQVEKKLAKWRGHMIESAKQCHTPFVPRLEAPKAFRSLVPYESFLGVWVFCALALFAHFMDWFRFPHDTKVEKLSTSRLILALASLAVAIYMSTGFMKDNVSETFKTPNLLSGIAPPAGHSYIYPKECPLIWNATTIFIKP